MCDHQHFSYWHESEVENRLFGTKSHFHSRRDIKAWNHDFKHFQVSLIHDRLLEELSPNFGIPLKDRPYHTVLTTRAPGTCYDFPVPSGSYTTKIVFLFHFFAEK